MNSYQIFSKRNKTFEYDVFEYYTISDKLRNQIYYIWKDALDIEHAFLYRDSHPAKAFEKIHDTVCREHGMEKLVNFSATNRSVSYARMCEHFLRNSPDYQVETLLDLIEVSFRQIEVLNRVYASTKLSKEEAIKELNQRFKENGIGYDFSNGILIRKDSEILHEEVTKPALRLLQEEDFEGALEEFLEAHDHYRKGEYKPSIVSASNAFESTMKTICSKQGWKVNGSGTSSQLINALVENELIPSYLDTHVNSLKNMMAGISNVRNNTKVSHGQGEDAVPVPEHFVNYALHLCATNIVFLIEAYRALPKQG